MKKTYFYLVAFIASVTVIAAFKALRQQSAAKAGADVKSITALTFSPDGTLFVGDSKLATVFAVKINETKSGKKAAPIEMKNIDQKIAAALGTDVSNITITDMAVSPVSQ